MTDLIVDKIAERTAEKLSGATIERTGEHALTIRLPTGAVTLHHYAYGHEFQAHFVSTGGERVEFTLAAAEAGIRSQFMYNPQSVDAVIEQFVRTCEHLASRAT